MNAAPAAPAGGTQQPPTPAARRYELDWLRVGAVFGLIPFHVAVIFTTSAFDYVKNAQTSAVMNFLVAFVTAWGIPLLFLVAGASARFALMMRGVSRYLNERVWRLVIPFIFGMLLIVPFQVYIGRLSTSASPPSYPAFYGQFLWSLAEIFTGKLPRGPDWIGHLWFIPPLMLFSALLIPFAWLLRTAPGKALVAWLGGAWHGYAVSLLLGLPLVGAEWLSLAGVRYMAPSDPGFASNAVGVVAYLTFFLVGYLLYLDERFQVWLRRGSWLALVAGAAAWLMQRYGAVALGAALPWLWLQNIATAMLRGYGSWWLVIGILGLGIRFLRFSTRLERYLTRAAYPVYIIHMTVLSLIGYWVVQLDWDIALKFLLIITLTFAVCLLIYEFLIRRIRVLRLLFGLDAGRVPDASRAATPIGASRNPG